MKSFNSTILPSVLILLSSAAWPCPTQAAEAARSGPEAAREQLKSLKVAAGLEVSLFASEPMVRNPANMDIDHKGRVWVTEGANYRVFQKWGNLRPEGDRIVILEDSNGDGVADKETTFYQGNDINAALGLCVLGNKVIVSRSPDVFVFTDTDGDGEADKKEVLFTGIKGVDHDHGVHAFVFGPDGKLYFNMGNDGREIHRPDGQLVTDVEGHTVATTGKPYRQGLVFRCNMDGSEFEVLGHNFRNNYEVSVDSFGTLWQSDNDDDGNKGVRINYVMEHGNYGYVDEMTGAGWQAKRTGWEDQIPLRHWHLNDPGVVPNVLQTGAGSPTGIMIYEGSLLPEIFRNQMIHCDAGPRVVRSYPVQPVGAGYQAQTVNILSTDDNNSWFRPSDVCASPDGSIYVADWNDAGVGGHNMADRELATMTGRVYRVVPIGKKPVMPKLKFDSASDCVASLASPNQEARYLAWTKLHAMGQKAESSLLKTWKSENPRHRARALHLLARIPGKEQKYVEIGLKDANPDIRITALRIARDRKLDVIPFVKALAYDPSSQVRRECALALRKNASPEVPALWVTLAKQHSPSDRWSLEALGIGAQGQEESCFDAWLKAVGAQWNSPVGRDIVWRSRATKAPALLVKLIREKSATQDDKNRYLRALDFIKGPEKEAALLDLVTAATQAK